MQVQCQICRKKFESESKTGKQKEDKKTLCPECLTEQQEQSSYCPQCNEPWEGPSSDTNEQPCKACGYVNSPRSKSS